jgi:hypothetical protein
VNGQPTNEYIRTETASSSCSATTILVRVNIVVFNLSETDEDNPGAFIGKNRYSATLHYEPITLNQGSLTLSANGVKLFKDYTGNTVSETSWNLASKTPPVYVYFEGTQAPSTGQITWKHSCGAEDSVKITVVEVKLKVDEKSWGQSSWNNPEDAGTYQKEGQERPWYFLWTTDEHRYRAEIKPTNAVNYVTSVTIGSFGNATKNTSGDWELIASNPTTGTYIDTIASATVNGRSCESDSVDIAVHALQSVGWNAVTGGATISGNKIYPEKPSPTANAQKNVNVVARIDRLPSAGMKGTVHLKRLDPMNQCTASVGTTNAVGTAPNDNNGTLNNVDGKTLEFTQGSGINAWVMGTFATAHPGDNYLVAAHQRQSIATSITIDNANPTQVADIVTGKKPVSSSILEVWRSLWAELDQMVLPAGTPAGFPSISGLVSSELEKAHITINSYLPNPRKEVNGQDPSHIINTSHFAQYANPCRDAPQPDI